MAVQVAIQSDFLDAFAKLPRKVQSKVSAFIVKFMNDPRAPGIGYEKIHGADGALCSVRIDSAYRGIVVRDDAAGVYLLLWVDHHDEAYEWARRKRVAVNPAVGSLQVYEALPVEEPGAGAGEAPAAPAPAPEPARERMPFAGLSDEELLELSVPRELLAGVRAMDSQAFRSAGSALPADAYENLSWVAEGIPVAEVLEMLRADRGAAPADTSLSASLENPETLRTFTVLAGEDELYEMLNAPLEKWRIFLHPSQRKVVGRTFRGPARVLGGAGTGKTVVAMHRAKVLAGGLERGQRLLFTTYSTSLALDISNNLAAICPAEAMACIDVVNLDAWVARFLERQGFEFSIVYEEDELNGLWEEAIIQAGVNLPFEPAFFREEWARVVMAQDIWDPAGYFQARRAGRGARLGRRERAEVWKVFEAYQRLMKLRGVRDIDAAMNECRLLVSQIPDPPRYAHVIVDEGQDFSEPAYRLLRALAGPEHENDLFIVGDTRQRIYGRKVVLSRCGINVRGRSSTLRINYRTTEEVRSSATRLLEGIAFDDLDGGEDADARAQSLSHGETPRLSVCATAEEEGALVIATLRELVGSGAQASGICIAVRTNYQVDAWARALAKVGMPAFVLRAGKLDDRSKPGVRVATMHRVKGLEFDYVLLPELSEQHLPPAGLLRRARTEGCEGELLLEERSLLYVAMTRARRAVFMSCAGHPSVLLGEGPRVQS